ncbi:putative signal peptide and transmembrane protein [Rhodopirellula islandica]|uniref:Signal peptide and transmembrane protein n=1 Tax=Rhodopirellula islandica TaxID=595434 RepID=A0A0J1BGN5_RHOIS|nr:BBP7 family outer membrane beta-barrel protein [Rhodopirellula islandica]KLU05703.1 putative signal peptide and transmembrane protein [Rhodopirellula islandica]
MNDTRTRCRFGFNRTLLGACLAIHFAILPTFGWAQATAEKSKTNFFPFPIRFGMKSEAEIKGGVKTPPVSVAATKPSTTSSGASTRRIPVERNIGKPNHAAFNDSEGDATNQPVSQVQHVQSRVSQSARAKLPADGRVVIPGTNGLPQFETPGEITSVEILDADGNPIPSELEEGEYYYGAQPAPVRVGQPLPGTLSIPARTAQARMNDFVPRTVDGQLLDGSVVEGEWIGEDETYAGEMGETYLGDESVLMEGAFQGQPHGHSPACDECGGNCVGACDDRIDARVRVLAHALSDPLHDLWIRADYMHLWVDGQNAPSLVTTGRAGTARDVAGEIGQLGTETIYGGMLGDEGRSAGRIEIGRYLGDTGLAISGSVLFSEEITQRFSADGSQYSILARPYVDVTPGGTDNGETADLIHFNNEIRGNISVDSSTEFGGADALVRALLINQRGRKMESFVGYRFLQLDDRLAIHDERRYLVDGGGVDAGTLLEQTDNLSVENRFHGATMGIRSTTSGDVWSFNTQVQLGIGVMHSSVAASGSSLRSEPQAGGGVITSQSNTGLLVRSTNSGVREFDELAVAPEIQLSVTRHFWNDWDVTIGYQFLYLSRVMRAAEQIDPLLNLSDLSIGGFEGSRRPDPEGTYNDLLAHGITFGVVHPF